LNSCHVALTTRVAPTTRIRHAQVLYLRWHRHCLAVCSLHCGWCLRKGCVPGPHTTYPQFTRPTDAPAVVVPPDAVQFDKKPNNDGRLPSNVGADGKGRLPADTVKRDAVVAAFKVYLRDPPAESLITNVLLPVSTHGRAMVCTCTCISSAWLSTCSHKARTRRMGFRRLLSQTTRRPQLHLHRWHGLHDCRRY